MEQHPIPRQITTFEFKLIGFMTLKQFIYLVIFLPLAYVVMSIFPIPVLNIILAALVAFIGIALAFIPVYDRPLDVYIKNFIKRIVTPTQFYYQKNTNNKNLQVNAMASPQIQGQSHVDVSQKLNQYMTQAKNIQKQTVVQDQKRKDEIKSALDLPVPSNLNLNANISTNEPKKQQLKQKPQETQQSNSTKPAFLTGVVKNRKQIPLPGILIYINDQNNNPLRLLKTDENGKFSSFNKLPEGVYDAEIKDPNNKHIFDKVKINLKEQNLTPFEFFSKELI